MAAPWHICQAQSLGSPFHVTSLLQAAAMADAGFLPAQQLENSPRHCTVVAIKPH